MDVLSYYAAFYRGGMLDLSDSSPPQIDQSIAISVDRGEEGLAYCPPGGLPELRAAIAARYHGVPAEGVVVTSGASEALAATAHVLLSPGAALVTGPGVYPSLTAAAARRGAPVVSLAALAVDISRSWAEEQFETRKGPAVICVTNPEPTTGSLLDLGSIATVATASGARLLADEVHAELFLTGERPLRAAELDPRAVSIGDLSKPAGVGGLRIGWAATRDVVLAAALRREVALLSGGPSAIAMRIALQVMSRLEAHLARLRNDALVRRNELVALLRARGWTPTLPEAGSTLLAAPPRPLPPDALERLRRGGLFLLPGDTLGSPGTIRFSLFVPLEPLEDALDALACARPVPCRSSRSSIVVLTKAPVAGFAKSRLATVLGAEPVAKLARAFLIDTLEHAGRTGHPVCVAVTPPSACAAVAVLAPGATVTPQSGGELGDRILAALGGALEGGPAVLVGSDTPELSPARFEKAFAALARHDLVLGPAVDGGFYLIGCSALPAGSLFEGVEWSTPSVFARVLANAGRLGLSTAVLGEQEDIDDAPSFARLVSRLSANPGAAPATAAAIAALSLEGVR